MDVDKRFLECSTCADCGCESQELASVLKFISAPSIITRRLLSMVELISMVLVCLLFNRRLASA